MVAENARTMAAARVAAETKMTQTRKEEAAKKTRFSRSREAQQSVIQHHSVSVQQARLRHLDVELAAFLSLRFLVYYSLGAFLPLLDALLLLPLLGTQELQSMAVNGTCVYLSLDRLLQHFCGAHHLSSHTS